MKKNHKNYILFFTIVVLAVAAFGLMLYSGIKLFSAGREGAEILGKKNTAVCKEFRFLDGVCLAEGETEKYPVAVMIDNKVEARPWSGLSYAGLVFEAPVEGGVTRFLAIYTTDKEIKKIGPVRSIRPYYIDWAREFGAIMMHVGGSPEALGIIAGDAGLRGRNIDGLGEYFWRSADRFAPHNAHTSSKLLAAAIDKFIKKGAPDFKLWEFKEDDFISERGESGAMKIKFNNYAFYDADWGYDKEKNVYERKDGEEFAKDEDGRMILAKNVAVLATDIEIIDAVSRRRITTVGSGDALIFQDGKKIEGKWEKKDGDSRLDFFDLDGKPIKFNRGMTWIEVTGDLGQVIEN